MKIVKSVLLASALCASVFSLSGCAETAVSQPAQSIATPNHWNAKIGQKCTVFSKSEIPIYKTVPGTLKSADDSWIVIGDFIDPTSNKRLEMHIRTSDVFLVTFPEDQGKK